MVKITFATQEDFRNKVKDGDYEISKAIVEGVLANLETTKRSIKVLEITVMDVNTIYSINVSKTNYLNTLEQNLPHFIKVEDYEGCAKITEAINALKNEKPPKKRVRRKSSRVL